MKYKTFKLAFKKKTYGFSRTFLGLKCVDTGRYFQVFRRCVISLKLNFHGRNKFFIKMYNNIKCAQRGSTYFHLKTSISLKIKLHGIVVANEFGFILMN